VQSGAYEQAVAAIEDREFPPEAGPRTRECAQALRTHIEESLRAVRT